MQKSQLKATGSTVERECFSGVSVDFEIKGEFLFLFFELGFIKILGVGAFGIGEQSNFFFLFWEFGEWKCEVWVGREE